MLKSGIRDVIFFVMFIMLFFVSQMVLHNVFTPIGESANEYDTGVGAQTNAVLDSLTTYTSMFFGIGAVYFGIRLFLGAFKGPDYGSGMDRMDSFDRGGRFEF